MTTTARSTAEDRPVFVLEMRAEPGIDPVHALRATLKVALRRHGLRCIAASEKSEERSS